MDSVLQRNQIYMNHLAICTIISQLAMVMGDHTKFCSAVGVIVVHGDLSLKLHTTTILYFLYSHIFHEC